MMIASRLSLRPAFCFPLRNPLYHRGVRVDCWIGVDLHMPLLLVCDHHS
ncbi:hypothetical protein NC651_010436 [Populus alba x Populus x berolinensis]|nr:hypothetical protein NC651_010436 [Populus alba x Populus x berolinensis]